MTTRRAGRLRDAEVTVFTVVWLGRGLWRLRQGRVPWSGGRRRRR